MDGLFVVWFVGQMDSPSISAEVETWILANPETEANDYQQEGHQNRTEVTEDREEGFEEMQADHGADFMMQSQWETIHSFFVVVLDQAFDAPRHQQTQA